MLNDFSLDPALTSVMAGQLGTGNLPPLYENAAAATVMGIPGVDCTILGEGGIPGTINKPNSINRMENHSSSAFQIPFVDPMYFQYLRTSDYAAAQLGALNDTTVDNNYLGNPYMSMLDVQNAYLATMLSHEKSQYGVPFGAKSRGSDRHTYPGNHASISGFSYPGSLLSDSVMPNSPAAPGIPLRHTDLRRFSSGMRSFSGSNMGGWHLDAAYDTNESSLLEEFKSNKTKCFELSDIDGHVVEFRYVCDK